MLDYSKRKKTWFFVVLIIIFISASQIYAESIWEGSAAMGRYGEFPFTGFYGASNSFPQNAFVEVENLENGKRTRVIIVNRLSDPGLLMLVSNEAAQELGIYQSDIARIKVRLLSSGNSVEAPKYDDLAYNPDPDINPAAALMEPEDLITKTTENEPAENKPAESPQPATVEEKPEPEPADLNEAEVLGEEKPVPPDTAVDIPEKPFNWDDTDVETASVPDELFEEPPVVRSAETVDLNEAEVLVEEKPVPPDSVTDFPEKPFDWSDTAIEPDLEPEPEPLFLTMDDLGESSPYDEPAVDKSAAHTPDASPLWPDDENYTDPVMVGPKIDSPMLMNEALAAADPATDNNVTADKGLDEPSPGLELLFAGLEETDPVYVSEAGFTMTTMPELVEKETDEEYITDSSGYHLPVVEEKEIAGVNLPEPEFEVPEEVIAVLVGDHVDFLDSDPEEDGIDTAYIDAPELKGSDEEALFVIDSELAEADPELDDSEVLTAESIPGLPGRTAPAELYDTDMAYASAPESGDTGLPDISEVPRITKAGEEEDTLVEDVKTAVPEYDENLEVTLVPAEARPPELIEEEASLKETEPEVAGEPEGEVIAEHSPDAGDEVSVKVEPEAEVAAEAAKAPAAEPEPEPEPEPEINNEPEVKVTVAEQPVEAVEEEDLIVPEQIMMVTKLQQKKHYLQIGAYKEKNSAVKAAGSLDAGYPVTILTDNASAEASYKLLLGPLTADESGVMLYNFRAGGYSDAFIRRIE